MIRPRRPEAATPWTEHGPWNRVFGVCSSRGLQTVDCPELNALGRCLVPISKGTQPGNFPFSTDFNGGPNLIVIHRPSAASPLRGLPQATPAEPPFPIRFSCAAKGFPPSAKSRMNLRSTFWHHPLDSRSKVVAHSHLPMRSHVPSAGTHSGATQRSISHVPCLEQLDFACCVVRWMYTHLAGQPASFGEDPIRRLQMPPCVHSQAPEEKHKEKQ